MLGKHLSIFTVSDESIVYLMQTGWYLAGLVNFKYKLQIDPAIIGHVPGTASLRAIVRSVVNTVEEFAVSYAIEVAQIVVTKSATSPISAVYFWSGEPTISVRFKKPFSNFGPFRATR
jgi:hypothetical protein